MPLRSLHSGNAAPTLSLLLLLLAVPRGAGAAGGVAAAALESPLAVNAAGAQLLTPIKYMAMGRAVFYEVPQPPVRGVVAFFHGCAHDASDLWPRERCAECDGLPEEVAHTKQALARGYAIIAIDAADATTRCFGVHTDRDAVVAILRAWLAQQGLQSKPLYAVGVSAGAAFALKLPMETPVHGVVSEVLGVLGEGWYSENLGAAYPPTAYISMPRDAKTAERIAANLEELRGMGVPADAILVHPDRLTDDYLSNRSELISPELSAKVVAALLQIGLIDGAGTLLADPRYTKLTWRAQLAALVPELTSTGDSLRADASHVSELLNRAYASHEIVSDHFTACLAWLEARGSVPLAGLSAQFAAVQLPGPRLRDLCPHRLHMLPMRRRQAATAGGQPATAVAALSALDTALWAVPAVLPVAVQ
ncbi:hypothetical protein C2E20_1340 [Micractinium conductrix]|uniref:Uncharacterized protein n=1 Tax=Micractinium conductrix TaxID=554055 RepID=A0A2P6VNY1_9CHLO|nr:hypothetical protein C2E20_1340 [Micractinium conductrix]|eukprot:PSC75811.1 hypothetical protein C2E20_1340 [Micractinium conductrix]